MDDLMAALEEFLVMCELYVHFTVHTKPLFIATLCPPAVPANPSLTPLGAEKGVQNTDPANCSFSWCRNKCTKY